MISVIAVFAQAPEKFTYQAVVRNASYELVTNASVVVKVRLLVGGSNGTPVFTEIHNSVTNANGLLTLEIGTGDLQQGALSEVDWGSSTVFLSTELDPDGGSNYTIETTQQLLSVPYALYANKAANSFSGDYNDLVNAPEIPQVPTDISAFHNDVGYITMDSISEIPTNVSAFVNDAGYLISYTEQQVLSISNDTIFLTGGSFVKLPEGFDGDYNSLSNTPDIPIVPTNVSAFSNDVGYLTSFTEQQVLSISNDTIFLTGGSFVKLPEGFDGDYNSLSNTPDIPVVPTNVSAFTNDVGYITIDSLPEIPALPENLSAFNNDMGFITTAQCNDVDICALADLVISLQNQLAALQFTIDSLISPDTSFLNNIITFDSEVIVLNEVTTWEQLSTTECVTKAFFSVTSGQRILFRHGNYHLANKLQILEYHDSNNNSPLSSYTELVLPKEVYVVPEGVAFIKLKSITGADTLTPAQCVEDNFHVIDVSGNNLQNATLLWEWNHSTSSIAQGMACANGYCFQAFADGYVDIWDLSTSTFVESLFFPVGSDAGVDCMHLNNLCFGDKYESTDSFGILWGNNESIGSSMVGVRVTYNDGHFSFEKIAEIAPPAVNDSMFIADDQYIDFHNKRLVQVVYKKNDNVVSPRASFSDTQISYYSFDSLTPSVHYSLISQFDFPIMWAMQGGRLINGLFYLVSGVENSENCINIFNLNNSKCIKVIDLKRDAFGIDEEPQGFEIIGSEKYVSTVNGLYRVNY